MTMSKSVAVGVAAAFLAVLAASSACWAQEGAGWAKKLYDEAVPDVFKPDLPPKVTGEGFCWRAAFYGMHFTKGYRGTGEEAFVEYGVKYCDALADAMADGPDGYKGFVGARPGSDVHVGDAVAMDGMLALAEVILGEPALKAKYGASAQRYVDLGRRDLIEKWDARGTWKEDGRAGAYVSGSRRPDANRPGGATRPAGAATGPAGATRPAAGGGIGLSIPFNKQDHVAACCLRLARLTGEGKFLDKARKIFSFQKGRFQYFDDHYLWNYWEPFGPWDIDLERPVPVPRHWIGVHPYRDYQDSEVTHIVEAYHMGVVFDKTDIQRILNTNLKVMWDGNKDRPFYRNSNATLPDYRKPKPTAEYPRVAGTLWTALADFDPTVRDLYAVRLKDAQDVRELIDRAYFQNVTCKKPPSFERMYAKEPVQVPSFEFTECKGLIAAFATPAQFQAGQKTTLLCKSPASGDLEIALYSADGKTKKAGLYTGKIQGSMDGLEGIVIRTWDGLDPSTGRPVEGDARIRWTFLGQYREQVVNVKKASSE